MLVIAAFHAANRLLNRNMDAEGVRFVSFFATSSVEF